jgi:hypothetical protein
MTVVTEFFEHANFGGASQTFNTNTGSRWHWIKFGSTLGNKVSSFRSNVVTGRAANVYAFKNNDFTGDFASLNVPTGWTCWWSNVGGQMNDDIESALILRRDSKEIVQALHALMVPDFKTQFDNQAAGTQVHRNGDPIIYALFFPSFDPGSMLVRIHQNLTVELDCWWDYDAWVRFDLQFTLSNNQIDGFCKWFWVWVEGGAFSGQIFNQLEPKMQAACSTLTAALRDKLKLLNLGAALAGYHFGAIYLLPGAQPSFPPSGPFGRIGNSNEDCCLVLTRTD